MPNWRSIPPEVWEQVFEALVLFFRRHGARDPDDEAQNTLLAILKREDYEFEKVEDIHIVSKGFARNILFEAYRRVKKIPDVPLGPLEPVLASPASAAGGAEAIETRIYLEEVFRIAAAKLRQKELDAIMQAVDPSGKAHAQTLTADERNKRRVFLHRSRQKLVRLIRGVMPDE